LKKDGFSLYSTAVSVAGTGRSAAFCCTLQACGEIVLDILGFASADEFYADAEL
jgi:hypothetical protein